jgi:hypothetical protein
LWLLSVDAVAALGAQLPMLVRGFYYEGWHPSGKPLKDRKKSEFLAHVAAELKDDLSEVCVELADGPEHFRREQADHVVAPLPDSSSRSGEATGTATISSCGFCGRTACRAAIDRCSRPDNQPDDFRGLTQQEPLAQGSHPHGLPQGRIATLSPWA